MTPKQSKQNQTTWIKHKKLYYWYYILYYFTIVIVMLLYSIKVILFGPLSEPKDQKLYKK